MEPAGKESQTETKYKAETMTLIFYWCVSQILAEGPKYDRFIKNFYTTFDVDKFD